MEQIQRIHLNVIDEKPIKLGIEKVRLVPIDMFPSYSGPTDIFPTSNNQILETTNTIVRSDITVHAIGYVEIDNEFGGQTAIISGH